MKTHISTVIFTSLVIIFANFWIWKVIRTDLLFGLILVLLTMSFIYLVIIKFIIRIFLFMILLTLLLSSQILLSGFDKNLVTLTPEQQLQLNERHGYFATDLGKLFQNKISLRFYKDISPYINAYQSNIFNSLSPNLYFFANHPRERANIEEFTKYPTILTVPFLIGLVYLMSSLQISYNLIFGYLIFAVLFSGFIKQSYVFGPILFFPLVNLLISLGFLRIYQVFKNDEF